MSNQWGFLADEHFIFNGHTLGILTCDKQALALGKLTLSSCTSQVI